MISIRIRTCLSIVSRNMHHCSSMHYLRYYCCYLRSQALSHLCALCISRFCVKDAAATETSILTPLAEPLKRILKGRMLLSSKISMDDVNLRCDTARVNTNDVDGSRTSDECTTDSSHAHEETVISTEKEIDLTLASLRAIVTSIPLTNGLALSLQRAQTISSIVQFLLSCLVNGVGLVAGVFADAIELYRCYVLCTEAMSTAQELVLIAFNYIFQSESIRVMSGEEGGVVLIRSSTRVHKTKTSCFESLRFYDESDSSAEMDIERILKTSQAVVSAICQLLLRLGLVIATDDNDESKDIKDEDRSQKSSSAHHPNHDGDASRVPGGAFLSALFLLSLRTYLHPTSSEYQIGDMEAIVHNFLTDGCKEQQKNTLLIRKHFSALMLMELQDKISLECLLDDGT